MRCQRGGGMCRGEVVDGERRLGGSGRRTSGGQGWGEVPGKGRVGHGEVMEEWVPGSWQEIGELEIRGAVRGRGGDRAAGGSGPRGGREVAVCCGRGTCEAGVRGERQECCERGSTGSRGTE